MKITKGRLRQIIKEEVAQHMTLREGSEKWDQLDELLSYMDPEQLLQEIVKAIDDATALDIFDHVKRMWGQGQMEEERRKV